MALLHMSEISKSFFGVEVLHSVHLDVEQGTVHALLGENGAGKSTLMNILTGVYTRDAGTVIFDGQELKDTTVKKSEAAGIAFVHQELNLFNELKVYENIFLNKERTKGKFFVNIKEMIKETQKLFDDLGVNIDATMEVGKLTTGQKQLLEIARALHQNAKLIILDEPTTALSNDEIDHLFNIVNDLKSQGKTFIFISHKMPEIFKIADDYTVFRNGSFISAGKIKDATPDLLTTFIVGKEGGNGEIYQERELGEKVLEIKNLRALLVNNVSFFARKGEIIGLTGLQGSGSSEFLQAIFGANPPFGGEIYVYGNKVKTGNIKDAMKKGLGMIPANRKENSIIPLMSLQENNSLAGYSLSKNPFINYRSESEKFGSSQEKMSIKCNSEKDLITSLSGGNQQKVIVGRWLTADSEILLLDNPTQGIDVGAKAEIYKLILQLSEQGKTILFNTLEINEIQKVADHCVIFYQGKIEKILSRSEIDEETVMKYATNAHKVSV